EQLSDSKQKNQSEKLDHVFLHLYNGYFNVMACSNYIYSLKSFISKERIGPRYLSRGVDHNGNVSNFIKTVYTVFSDENLSHSEMNIHTDRSELLKVIIYRGSIPLFWTQSNNLREMQVLKKDHFNSFFKHFYDNFRDYSLKNESADPSISNQIDEQQKTQTSRFLNDIDHFNQILVINLLGDKKEEKQLSNLFLKHLLNLNIKYLNFNLNKYHMDYKKMKSLFDGKLNRALNDLNNQNSDKKVIFRVNCLDCLDRTNLASFFICDHYHTLYNQTLKNSGNGNNLLDRTFLKELFKENGNILSIFNSGSNALKNELTYKEKRSIKGMLDDFYIFTKRILHDKFTDKEKLAQIEILLGRSEQIPEEVFENHEMAEFQTKSERAVDNENVVEIGSLKQEVESGDEAKSGKDIKTLKEGKSEKDIKTLKEAKSEKEGKSGKDIKTFNEGKSGKDVKTLKEAKSEKEGKTLKEAKSEKEGKTLKEGKSETKTRKSESKRDICTKQESAAVKILQDIQNLNVISCLLVTVQIHSKKDLKTFQFTPSVSTNLIILCINRMTTSLKSMILNDDTIVYEIQGFREVLKKSHFNTHTLVFIRSTNQNESSNTKSKNMTSKDLKSQMNRDSEILLSNETINIKERTFQKTRSLTKRQCLTSLTFLLSKKDLTYQITVNNVIMEKFDKPEFFLNNNIQNITGDTNMDAFDPVDTRVSILTGTFFNDPVTLFDTLDHNFIESQNNLRLAFRNLNGKEFKEYEQCLFFQFDVQIS
ncbi:Inositol-1,4,5-triphosphate 5-phosphatase (synaptojanin), INP51/INP52/INP53 family, partial [Pseudoloma neurophilia]